MGFDGVLTKKRRVWLEQLAAAGPIHPKGNSQDAYYCWRMGWTERLFVNAEKEEIIGDQITEEGLEFLHVHGRVPAHAL